MSCCTWSTIVIYFIYVSDTAQFYWKVWYAAFLSISLSCHLCKLNGKICQQLFHCLAIPSSILVYVKDVHQTNSLHLWRSQLNIESCLCQAKCFHEWLCRNTCKNCNTDPIHAQYIKADHNPTPTLNTYPKLCTLEISQHLTDKQQSVHAKIIKFLHCSHGHRKRGVCRGSDTPNYLCGGDINMYIPLEKPNT